MSSILKVDTIQDQSGNNIINESGNVITIGASGDTITVPAGATVSGFTSAGIDDNATSVAITIDSSERVGIGTTSPPFLLSLSGNSEGISFTDTSGGSNAKAWLMQGLDSDFRLRTQLDNYGGGQVATIISRTAEVVNTHQFFTEDSERMRLTTTGLGIGTSSPDNSLHVLYDDSTTYSVNTHNSGIQIENNNGTDNTFSQLHFRTGNADSYIRNIREGSNLSSLAFLTDNGGATGDVGEAMRINSSGQVGIGTSSPAKPLEIVSSAQTTLLHLNSTAGTTSAITFENTGSNDSITIGAENDDLKLRTDDGVIKFFTNENSEKMRIDSSGKVGIGETSMDALLVIKGDSDESTTPSIRLKDGSDSREAWITNTAGDLILSAGGNDNVAHTQLRMLNGNLMTFKTDNTERMRIASNGDAYFNKTSDSFSTTGVGILNTSQVQFVAANQGLLYCNRLSSDGQLAIFFQDNTEEGSINVSGSTVSYNGFTGTHWSRFQDNSTPTILRGTVLETLDEMCDWYNLEFDVITQDDDGNDVTTSEKIPHVLLDSQSDGDVITYNHEGTDYQATIVKEADVKHMMSKVSDNSDAKNVYGVFVAYDEDGEGYNDFYVASVGSFVVRIKANETIAKGDLLQSNGDGTAKVQTDDAVRSSSFAKVLSTTIIETYEDGSYLVPCSLMC